MRGVTVTLFEKTVIGKDDFNAPVYAETAVSVDNVLIGQPSTEELQSSTEMYGKRIDYMLGIPKGDTHEWQDRRVEWTDAYGLAIRCVTFGFPMTGIEALVPGQWHMKVRCMRVE